VRVTGLRHAAGRAAALRVGGMNPAATRNALRCFAAVAIGAGLAMTAVVASAQPAQSGKPVPAVAAVLGQWPTELALGAVNTGRAPVCAPLAAATCSAPGRFAPRIDSARLTPAEAGCYVSVVFSDCAGESMSELMIADDGRYLSGDVPFGYTLWGDRLVEVPAELDACITAIRLTKQGRPFDEVQMAVREQHGTGISRAQFDGLFESLYRRYGPL